MGILNIRPAELRNAHLLIQLYGGPRSGKTRSALLLARGLVGPKGKIGILCTEQGRANLHLGKIPGDFFVGQLTPPFTAERYREAVHEFLRFGVDILIIDSFSHIWEGEGGVLDQADDAEAEGKKGLKKWLHKRKYKRTVNMLLGTKMHMIFCSRAKQPMLEIIEGGKKKLVPGPWEPIQDKFLKYEMTIVLPMLQDGRYETAPDLLKVPDGIAPLFDGSPVSVKTGEEISSWLGGMKANDAGLELLRIAADDAAGEGTDAFRDFWASRTKAERQALLEEMDNYKSKAKSADDLAEERRKERASIAPDDPFSGPSDKLMTIADVGNQLPGIDALLAEIDAITDVKQLLTWWNTDKTDRAVLYLEGADHDGWEKVCDAYEARREALATITDLKAS